MRQVEAVLGCEEKNPNSVIHRGEELEANLTGNTHYPTPPSLLTLGAALTDAQNARTAWNEGAGSEAQRVAYEAAIHVLFGLIEGELNYVNLTTPHDEAAIATSGFPASADPHGLPLLEAPQNLHRFIARNLGMEKVKLNCKRPANAAATQRPHYKFFRSTTPDFPTAVVIGEGSKTTHTDVPAVTVATTFYYWVTAQSPAGESEPSDLCRVVVVPL